MINNNNSHSWAYVRGTNYGAYFAYFLLSYEYSLKVYSYATPYFLAGESFEIPLPFGCDNIWFYGKMWPNRLILSSGVASTDRPLCYEFYGTVFNPSCERVECKWCK